MKDVDVSNGREIKVGGGKISGCPVVPLDEGSGALKAPGLAMILSAVAVI